MTLERAADDLLRLRRTTFLDEFTRIEQQRDPESDCTAPSCSSFARRRARLLA